MNDFHDAPEPWTPAELEQLRALRVDSVEDRVAEARTVAALRKRGLLVARPAARWRVVAIATGIAAAAFLFLGGVAVGRKLGASENRPGAPAFQVQRAGSAYVAALMKLSQ